VTRIPWANAPHVLRDAVESALANIGFGRVVTASSISGGFSPGVVEHLGLDDGHAVFLKAASSTMNPVTPTLHLGEARILQQLPASMPWVGS
jgi:hypothetical protein